MGLEYSQSRGGHDDRIYCTECMYKYMEKNARPLRNSSAVKGRFRIATYQKVQSTYGVPIVPYGKLGLGELLNPVSTNPLTYEPTCTPSILFVFLLMLVSHQEGYMSDAAAFVVYVYRY